MVLGKMWLFYIGNGAEIRPLEMGRKSPENIPLPRPGLVLGGRLISMLMVLSCFTCCFDKFLLCSLAR